MAEDTKQYKPMAATKPAPKEEAPKETTEAPKEWVPDPFDPRFPKVENEESDDK